MTQKEWILANLEGKVQKRALRACEEQNELDKLTDGGLACAFVWIETKEDWPYWNAIYEHLANPDQYLPEGYVDVDHVVDANEMIKDEFLEWLEKQMKRAEASPNLPQAYWAWSLAKEKYTELKNAPKKSS